MDATPSLLFGCTDTDVGGVLLDAHQAYTYLAWSLAAGTMGACGATIVDLDDLSCVQDRPSAGGTDPVNGGVAWVDPISDDACWYDSSVAASGEFLGLLVTRVDVGRPSVLRDVAPLVGMNGGRPGRASRQLRQVRITGTAWARSKRGLLYGVDWLERVMADDACAGGGTQGTVLQVRTWCGDSAPDTAGRVSMFGAVLTGFSLLDVAPTSWDPCCEMRSDVEMIITCANPYVYLCSLVDSTIDTSGPGSTLTVSEEC